MDNTNALGRAANHLKEIANKISTETKHSPQILDLGGGLGIPFSYDDKQYPSIESFGKSLTPVIDKAFVSTGLSRANHLLEMPLVFLDQLHLSNLCEEDFGPLPTLVLIKTLRYR